MRVSPRIRRRDVRRRVSRKRRVRCANGDVRVPPGVQRNPAATSRRRSATGATDERRWTAASAASWSDADEAYEIVETTCECSDEYMGANCTIPCPCAPGAPRTRRVRRRLARSRRGVRRCDGRRLGDARATRGGSGRIAACRVPRVSRIKGTARPRRGSKSAGRALADVDADVTHAPEAARRKRR